jgi:hypothetical protein
MALLSPAATLVRSRRAAVAANALLCNYIGAGISMFHFYVDFLISLSQFSQLSLSPLLYISLHTLHLPPHLHLHLNLPRYLYLTSLHRKQSQNGGEQFAAFCVLMGIFWILTYKLLFAKNRVFAHFRRRQVEAAANNFRRFEKSNLKGH